MILDKYRSKQFIFKAYLSPEKDFIIFSDPFRKSSSPFYKGNYQVGKRFSKDYPINIVSKLPCYLNCFVTDNLDIVVNGFATIIPKLEWNRLPSNVKGIYKDVNNIESEYNGRKIVVGSTINPQLGNCMLIEGVHFIIV